MRPVPGDEPAIESSQRRELYWTRGFVHLGRLVDPDTALRLSSLFREHERVGDAIGPYGILRHNAWREMEGFAELIASGGLARPVCALLGVPRLTLFQDNVICKPPGTRDPIAWHQDYSYWPLDSPGGATLWLALDGSTPESGCLHYLPGSHLLGERRPANFVAGSGQPHAPHLPEADWELRATEACAPPLAPGEAILHHPLVAHLSPPNDSSEYRTGYSLTWLTEDVRWDPAHAPHPFNHDLGPRPGAAVEGPLFPRFGSDDRRQRRSPIRTGSR